MNEDLASQKEAWEELQQPIKDTASVIANGVGGALSGVVKALSRGQDAAAGLFDRLGDIGDQLIDMGVNGAVQMGLNALMNALGGAFGGGGFGVGKGLTGAATYGFTGNGIYGIPSYDGGGFTGNGGGPGLDGKGGFLAMLHPNETITPGSSGGRVRIELGPGLVGTILDQSMRQSVEVVHSYDKGLTTSIADKQRRGSLGF